MRILILGGDGYLGWPTAMAFCRKGHDVCVVDNYLRRNMCRDNDEEPLYPVPNLIERARVWEEVSGKDISVKIGDCCGFGFRHVISEREFTRSFAIDRKIKVAVEEAQSDVMIGHDTGCITTLDKNQWIGKAVGKDYSLPVLADIQFAALACGAHPYKIVQSHWHASATETLMEKMGIDWQAKKVEFEAYLKEVEAGRFESLYDPRLAITSGPGFNPPKLEKTS